MKQSTKQNTAATLMLEGMSDTDIAKRLRVSRVTVWRWRNSPEVVAILSAERNRRIEHVSDRMRSLVDKALDVIESVIDDPSTAPMVRVKAATVILNRAGVTERAALEARQQSVSTERGYARHLDELDNPMSLANLTAGLGL